MKAKLVIENIVSSWEKDQDLNNLGAFKIGTNHYDYLENLVKILDIDTGNEIQRKYGLDLAETLEETDSERTLDDYFYYTKIIKSDEAPKGTTWAYPVEYDYSSYWGLNK
jgi:hypothetical protein